MRRILIPLACLLVCAPLCRAGNSRQPIVLKVTADADQTEVHPDGIIDVTLSLENPTGVAESIKIPERCWDHLWKSSNHVVTWDAWDSDDDSDVTIEIPPHGSYDFPEPLKMYVDTDSQKEFHTTFRMGFKTSFSKVFWSDPITLDVTP